MSQRYQREIEEILDQVNEDAPADKPRSSQKRQQTHVRPPKPPRSGFRLGLSSGRLMLMGLGLLVLSLLLLGVAPSFAAPAAWIGIGLLITAYVVFFTKPRRTVERRWRGQSIEDEPQQSGLQRFWSWLTRG